MTPQDSIRTTSATRMAALAGAGAKVGLNYLKHYGRRAVGGEDTTRALHEENAAAVYQTFSELKGGPLKLAQMLSVDQHLLPPAYARQFALAQYSAPPLSYPLVVRTFRREFGLEPREMFDQFTTEAAHGASIGQVHRAEKEGHTYAVKVQYPGVADSLRSDLRVVKPIALQILGLRESDVADYFREVETRLIEETDYALELERSIQLSQACSHLSAVRFPRYYPELSTKRILTMDWIEGIPLDRFADSDAGQQARDTIGQALWDFYHYQVHGLHLFHADPHPGNYLIRDGELWVLDFGCTKAIDEDFYRKQFRFLDPAVLADHNLLEKAMTDLNVLLPTDSPSDRAKVVELCTRWLELLAKPFRSGTFDFGDPDFLRAIYEMGEESRQNNLMRTMRGRRGSADSIYVNRAFFGLYSLLGRLRARVNIQLPEWLREPVALH